jgi:uncharacterized protein
MIIDINRIPPEGCEYSGDESASILDVEKEVAIRFDSPLHYDLKAIRVSKELIVIGRLTLAATFRCSRCGESFSRQIKDPSFECVREVADINESVDLTPDIRESMLLALPSYPVCSPDCKGLCSQCGANLNRGQCACRPLKEASGWEMLDSLKIEN